MPCLWICCFPVVKTLTHRTILHNFCVVYHPDLFEEPVCCDGVIDGLEENIRVAVLCFPLGLARPGLPSHSLPNHPHWRQAWKHPAVSRRASGGQQPLPCIDWETDQVHRHLFIYIEGSSYVHRAALQRFIRSLCTRWTIKQTYSHFKLKDWISDAKLFLGVLHVLDTCFVVTCFRGRAGKSMQLEGSYSEDCWPGQLLLGGQ